MRDEHAVAASAGWAESGDSDAAKHASVPTKGAMRLTAAEIGQPAPAR